MEKKALIKAAKELNDVLGLDPKIATKGAGYGDLKANILKAAELIEEGDEITEATIETIETLKTEPEDAEGEGNGKGKKEKAPKPPREPKDPKSTRVGAAGQAIREAAGKKYDSDALIARINEIVGDVNDKESRTNLLKAHHALIGFGAIEIGADGIINLVE